jgi:hypothetical protein
MAPPFGPEIYSTVVFSMNESIFDCMLSLLNLELPTGISDKDYSIRTWI